MRKLFDFVRVLLVAVAAAMVGFGLSAASAIAGPVYDFPLELYVGSGTPPAGPWGTVELAPTGSNVLVTVTLDSNIYFASTGAGYALTFDLTNGGSTVSPISISGLTSGFSLVSTTAGSLHVGGAGYWDYGINCDACGSGGSSPHIGTFSFTLSNIDYSYFSDGSSADTSKHAYSDIGYLFSSDLCFYNAETRACALTGVAVSDGNTVTGGCLTPGDCAVPEPISLSLFGAGLAGALAIRRRKKTG